MRMRCAAPVTGFNIGAPRISNPINAGTGSSAVDVELELEVDVGDDRLVQRVASRGKDLEHGCAGVGVFAPQDAQERRPLLGRGASVDDMHTLALALVNGAGPAEDAGRP